MDYTVTDFQPGYEMSYAEYRAVCNVGGLSFENINLRIDFDKVIYRPAWEGCFLQLRLLHIGIETDLYVRSEDIHRLIGVDVKYLSEDYLSFLVTKRFSKYGISFHELIHDLNKMDLSFLLKAMFITDGIQQAELFIDARGLTVENEYLSKRRNKLSGDLTLSTTAVLFKTYLSPSELENLNSDDIVLIYNE